MQRFFGEFNDENDVIEQFRIAASDLEGCEVIAALYSQEDYEGSAFVIFRRDGKLYEVHGSHCSCFGLENQWEPETVVALELAQRMDRETGWPEEFRKVVQAAVS